MKYRWQLQDVMAVEVSKFLLLHTSENYKQVEILLKWVDELLLENIFNVYVIYIISNEHQFYSKVCIVDLTALNFTENCRELWILLQVRNCNKLLIVFYSSEDG